MQTQAQVGMFRLQLERVVAERTRALAESEKQYRLLTQMSPVCIYRRDHLVSIQLFFFLIDPTLKNRDG